MDPLLITTQVDLSGAQALSAGVVAAMTKVIAAQQAVNEQARALKDTYASLGAAAAQGSSQAAAAIAEEMGVLAEAKIALEQAREAYTALSAAKNADTEATVANTAATGTGIGATRAATAAIGLAEGRLMGSTRAAGAFLATTLGLGPALQAAFPVIGALALLSVLYQIGKEAYTLYQNIANLKAEIDALGTASEKTAREAAAANWEYVQSYGELLKAQGKFAEAEAFIQAHAGEKPLHLSLGIAKEQLKELPAAMQEFARSLEQVNVVGQKTPVFEQLDKQAAEAKKRIEELNKLIANPPTVAVSTGFASSGVTSNVPADTSHYKAELAAATEYYNALENVRNSQQSRESAESNKVARDRITLAKDAAQQAQAAAKQEEEATVGSLAQQKASAELLYRQGIIDAQQWADAIARADDLALAAHEQYYTKAIAAFNAAGDAQKANQLIGERDKEIGAEKAKSAADDAKELEKLNKTLEEYQGEAIKSVAVTKDSEEGVKSITEATKEWLKAMEELRKSNETLRTASQQFDYSARASAIQVAAAGMVNSERFVRAQLRELYQDEYNDAVSKQAELRAQLLAERQRLQGDLAALQAAPATPETGAGIKGIQTQLEQEQAAYNATDAAILTAQQKLNQQIAQLTIQTIKQQEAALNEFVNQSVSAFNQFAVTAITATGTVNGRISEMRFLGQQWSKMVFQMEQDFLRSMLKMVEDTALIQNIKNVLEKGLSGLFSHIGLGAVHAGAGAVGGAAGTTAKTAAETQATAALNAFSLALTHATSVTTASLGVKTTDTSATAASATAKTTEAAAATAGTGAHIANTAAVTGSTIAQHGNTVAVTVGTIAHHAHAAAVFVSLGSFIAHEAAVIGDTIALIFHKLVSIFTAGAQTGGLIQGPGTGTSDSIQMNVSHGEYIVKADSVNKPGILPLLHAINAGKVGSGTEHPAAKNAATGGLVGFAATGGVVSPAFGTSGTTDVRIISAPTMERSLIDIAHNTAYLTKSQKGHDIASFLFGFAEGGIVPFTGLHLVHQGERVLSVQQRAEYEDRMSAMAGSGLREPGEAGGVSGAPGRGGDDNSSTAFHYHAGNVSALDASGAQDIFRRHSGEMVKIVREGIRSGALKPRELMR